MHEGAGSKGRCVLHAAAYGDATTAAAAALEGMHGGGQQALPAPPRLGSYQVRAWFSVLYCTVIGACSGIHHRVIQPGGLWQPPLWHWQQSS